MGATVFEIPGEGGFGSNPPPPLVKGVGTKRLGKGRLTLAFKICENRPKTFLVKILYIQKFGWTHNCLVEVSLKWSNQPCTPSATPFLNIQLNINQIKCFMDQSLSWLIVDQKQFQFRKSKILFACYAPLNS